MINETFSYRKKILTDKVSPPRFLSGGTYSCIQRERKLGCESDQPPAEYKGEYFHRGYENFYYIKIRVVLTPQKRPKRLRH